MQLVIKTITPTDAQAALDWRMSNRAPRKRHVERLSRDMATGNWQMNGAPIVFDDTGKLIDGQHRLLACVKSGAPFNTAVLSGVRGDVVCPTIDTGKARHFGDALKMRGMTRYVNETASAVRHLMAVHKNCTISALRDISHSELSQFLEDSIDGVRLRDAVEAAAPAKLYAPTAPLAAIFYASDAPPSEKAEFCESIATGSGLCQGSPVLTYREWVMKARVKRATIRPDTKMNALCMAWNAFLLAKPMRAVRAEKRPEIL